MNQVRVGVAVILKQIVNGKICILLGKRKGSHGAGTWAFPGGHMDFGETSQKTIERELEEETGITGIALRNTHRFVENFFEKENKHYITLLYVGLTKGIDAQIKEPDKCEEWRWCPKDELPSPLFPPVAKLLNSTEEDMYKII